LFWLIRDKIFLCLLSVILALVVVCPVSAAAGHLSSIDLIESAYRNGEIGYSEAADYKVTAIFRPDSLPAMYRSKGIIKSATPIIMEARLNKHLLSPENQRILAKGRVTTLTDLYGSGVTLQSYASPEGRFRIHFTTDNTNGDAVPAGDTDGDGTPDYVEQFAVILDNVWTTEIGVLGYDAPPSDETEGGDCLLDVYLADLPAYGFTQIDEFDPASMVYMIFENDFAGFPPNTDPEGQVTGDMKVVAAHEFFHTIQFQITEDICTSGWWMEASATWMEDYVYPEVNDYINYIDYWFHYPQLPLNTYNSIDCTGNGAHSLFPYGTTIWIKHMTEKYGSKFVYDVWNKIKDGVPNVSALSAVNEALTDRGTTLEEELKELRVANVTMTYEDASWYQSWQSVNTDPTLQPIVVEYSGNNPGFSSSVAYTDVSILPLATKYYSFSAPQGSGNLTIDFNGIGNISVMVIGFNAGDTSYDVTEVVTDLNNDGSVIINGFDSAGPYSRIVVIPANYSTESTSSFSMTVSYTNTPSGSISSIDVKADTTSIVTGDNGISGKQQYYFIMTDNSGNQVLQSGTTWADNSPYIDIDGNGLAVVTNVVTGEGITASLQSFLSTAVLSAASPATMPAGTPRACAANKSDSRCFIATAAFGSPLHPYVGLLREFRDSYMLTNPMGRWFVTIYYNNSPPIAEIIKDNSGLKAIVKIFLIPAIIVSWAMLKTTLSEKIIIAVLLAILINIILYLRKNIFKTYVP